MFHVSGVLLGWAARTMGKVPKRCRQCRSEQRLLAVRGDLEAAIDDGSGARISTPRRQAVRLGCLRDVHDNNSDFAALGRRERLLQTLL